MNPGTILHDYDIGFGLRPGNIASILIVLILLGCCAISSGCKASAPGAPKINGAPAYAAVDKCAERLHDICGYLLLFYNSNSRPPKSLNEIGQFIENLGESIPLMCPESGEMYIYSPEGLPVSDPAGRVILYDARPVHDGIRWGIMMEQFSPGKPMSLRVIMVPGKIENTSR